jgi:general secretion pathway protein M
VNAVAWFRERTPRERLALTAGAVIVLVLVFYGWIWLPLTADTARLRVSVPPLRKEAAQLAADAVEATRLAASPKPQQAGEALGPAVEQSISAAGLKDRLQVLPLDGSRVQLSTEGIGFNEWINLLAILQQSRNARVESARVEPQPGSALVRVQAVLARPQSAKRPS